MIMKKRSVIIEFVLLFASLSPTLAQTPLFSLADTSACAEEWMKFENLYPDFCGYDYQWDWGDGSQDTSRGKILWHNYAQPGAYTASMTMIGDNYLYVLRSITVSSIPANWVNIPFDLKPDIYFKFRGVECENHDFDTHKHASNLTLPHTFQLNRMLGRGIFEVEVWDYDASLFDDKISEFTLNMAGGSGSYTKSHALGDLNVSWIIDSIPISTFTQAITIDPGPTVPVVQTADSFKLCADSLVLFASSDPGLTLQWYKDDQFIGSGDTLVAFETGFYKVEALNPTGCSPISRPELIALGGGNIKPDLAIDPTLSQPRKYICYDGSKWISSPEFYGGGSKSGDFYSPTYYTYTWYKDGSIQSNPNSQAHYFLPKEAGKYWVMITDTVGCYGYSDTVNLSVHVNTPPDIYPSDTAYYCGQDTLTLQTNTSHWLKYQWYKDYQAIPDTLGGQNPTFKVSEPGIYSVVHEDSSRCFLPVHVSNAPYVNIMDTQGVPYPINLRRNGDTLFTIIAANYQWIDAQTQNTVSTDPYFIPSAPGQYFVAVIDTNGCDAKSDVMHFYMTDIEEKLTDGQVSVYPNPSDGLIYISLDQLARKSGKFSLLNANGSLLRKGKIDEVNKEYDFSSLPGGVYFLKIELEGFGPISKKLVFME
jgi:hypothetical protein